MTSKIGQWLSTVVVASIHVCSRVNICASLQQSFIPPARLYRPNIQVSRSFWLSVSTVTKPTYTAWNMCWKLGGNLPTLPIIYTTNLRKQKTPPVWYLEWLVILSGHDDHAIQFRDEKSGRVNNDVALHLQNPPNRFRCAVMCRVYLWWPSTMLYLEPVILPLLALKTSAVCPDLTWQDHDDNINLWSI